MASNNSIFSSIQSEKRWILEVDNNFPQEQVLDIDFDTPTSVFRVPKTLSETKPEAYAPQCIGLGPYHHTRPDVYQMQKQKLSAVRKFMNQRKQQTFQQVVNALVHYEPVLRACYDQYLDLDIQTLARILAIDGLYLLYFLENYSSNDDPDVKEVIGDVLMLENQIPIIMLEKIAQNLQFKQHEYESLFITHFQNICEIQSPLKLKKIKINDSNHLHLLNQMYYLIVNYRGPESEPQAILLSDMCDIFDINTQMSVSMNDVDTVLGFLGQQGASAAAPALKILSFVKKVPWDRISGLFKKGDRYKKIPGVEEIDIPSVSEMTEMAEIQFTLTHGGIRDIQYVELEGAKTFYLPVISLKPTSEIVLRNLVAVEAVTLKPGSTREFAEYVDLMCGLIDTKKDVDILRKAEIIESELADEEIVSIFNGIKKSTGMNNIPQSDIERAIDAGKKQYDNMFKVKSKRIAESYGSALVKFLKPVFYVLILVLLTLQAYCSVFGCSRWFGKGSAVQGVDNLLHSE